MYRRGVAGVIVFHVVKNAATSDAAVAEPSGSWGVAAALAMLVVVICLHLASPLPEWQGLEGRGQPFARGRLLGQMLETAVAAPDIMALDWAGGQASPWMTDRLPVALTAAAIIAAAAAIGWLLLVAIGIHRQLSSFEQFVFACGVGLHAVSLVVLAVGLAGWLNGMRWPMIAAGAAAVGGWLVCRQRVAGSIPPSDGRQVATATAK